MAKDYDVLIIEPHKETRECLVDIFTHLEGLSVVAVEGGLEALESLKESRPKMILMDYHIPKIDDKDFLTIKAEDPEICCIPLIVMSTLPNKLAGMKKRFELIKKPFDINVIIEYIQKYM